MKGIRTFALLACALGFAVLHLHGEDDLDRGLALLSTQRAHPANVRPITLAEAESAALIGNPELRLAARRLTAAEAHVPAAGRLADPDFTYRDWGTPLARPWDLNQAQQMFMVSRSLPARGVRDLSKKIASGEVEIQRSDFEARKRDVLARVRLAYYALVRNQRELALHDEQVAIAQQSIESSRIKYTVGKVAQQDVLKAQIATTKLVEHLVMLEQDGDSARATLNTLLGRDAAAPLEVAAGGERSLILPGPAELQAAAMKSRPELATIAAQIQQAELKVGLARKGLSPGFTVGGGYMLMPEGSPRRNAYMAELSITLPGANRQKHEAEIAAAQAEVASLRAELEAERASVGNEIQQALVRATAASRLLRLYRETLIPQTNSALRAAVAAYQNDRTDLLNLLESQNLILEVRTAHYRAAAEYDSAVAELERAVGAPVATEVQP